MNTKKSGYELHKPLWLPRKEAYCLLFLTSIKQAFQASQLSKCHEENQIGHFETLRGSLSQRASYFTMYAEVTTIFTASSEASYEWPMCNFMAPILFTLRPSARSLNSRAYQRKHGLNSPERLLRLQTLQQSERLPNRPKQKTDWLVVTLLWYNVSYEHDEKRRSSDDSF